MNGASRRTYDRKFKEMTKYKYTVIVSVINRNGSVIHLKSGDRVRVRCHCGATTMYVGTVKWCPWMKRLRIYVDDPYKIFTLHGPTKWTDITDGELEEIT